MENTAETEIDSPVKSKFRRLTPFQAKDPNAIARITT